MVRNGYPFGQAILPLNCRHWAGGLHRVRFVQWLCWASGPLFRLNDHYFLSTRSCGNHQAKVRISLQLLSEGIWYATLCLFPHLGHRTGLWCLNTHQEPLWHHTSFLAVYFINKALTLGLSLAIWLNQVFALYYTNNSLNMNITPFLGRNKQKTSQNSRNISRTGRKHELWLVRPVAAHTSSASLSQWQL